MSCGSCGSGGGCSTGSGGCSTGCGKLDVHDWLGDMSRPLNAFDGVEVRFKGGRKEFYRNVNNLELFTGDVIVVECSPGHHIGEVTMQGEMVRLQMKKKNVAYGDDLSIIYRKANVKDIEKFEQARNRELTTLYRSRELVREQKLEMKLSDVEFQADNSKGTFFYSAEDRVDFRELIKILATEFKIRVEMKQISLRQEAGRLGGIGSCGRELCCANWLTEFKNVNTSAARYQNLSLNPLKLSGQCGRLKCCLNYELETYISAVKEIPDIKAPIRTKEGLYFLQKTDIFKKIMFFSFEKDNNWIPVNVERVNEVLELTKKGIEVFSLTQNEEDEYEDVEMNSDLLALDKKLKKKSNDKITTSKNRNEDRTNQKTNFKSTSQTKIIQKINTQHPIKKEDNKPSSQQNTKFETRQSAIPKREKLEPKKVIQTKEVVVKNIELQKKQVEPLKEIKKETPKIETQKITTINPSKDLKSFIPKRQNFNTTQNQTESEKIISEPKIEPVKEKSIEQLKKDISNTTENSADAPKIRRRENVQNNNQK